MKLSTKTKTSLEKLNQGLLDYTTSNFKGITLENLGKIITGRLPYKEHTYKRNVGLSGYNHDEVRVALQPDESLSDTCDRIITAILEHVVDSIIAYHGDDGAYSFSQDIKSGDIYPEGKYYNMQLDNIEIYENEDEYTAWVHIFYVV